MSWDHASIHHFDSSNCIKEGLAHYSIAPCGAYIDACTQAHAHEHIQSHTVAKSHCNFKTVPALPQVRCLYGKGAFAWSKLEVEMSFVSRRTVLPHVMK